MLNLLSVYRRDRDNMPGSAREVENAIEEGRVLWLSSPKNLSENKVKAVEVNKIKLGDPDPSGRKTCYYRKFKL